MKNMRSAVMRLFLGRINRKVFITGYIAIFVLYNFLNFIFHRGFFSPLKGGFESFFYLLLISFICSLVVRRLHDVGLSGWFVLIIFAPVFNILLTLFLLIKQGDKTANLYGSPPAKNTSLFSSLLHLRNH